jgi:tetratricopeptide (TPR) repeat protein
VKIRKNTNIFVLVMLILFASGCDENKTADQRYSSGLNNAIKGKFKKAKNDFKAALNDESHKSEAQGSLNIVEDVLSEKLDKEAAIPFFKGIKYANEGQMTHAYSYFSKAIKIAPDFAGAYYERGIVNGRLKLYTQAISDFTKSIRLNPKDTAAFNNRGLAFAKGLIKLLS